MLIKKTCFFSLPHSMGFMRTETIYGSENVDFWHCLLLGNGINIAIILYANHSNVIPWAFMGKETRNLF